MNPQLKKFRLKLYIEALLKCLLYALSIGLFTCAFFIFLTKMLIFKLNYSTCIFIGVGTFVLSFIILFIIYFPTEIKIAKRLDEDLNLKEKVKTMVYYKHSNEPMLVVQREHTNNILSSYSAKNISFKIAILGILITFISSGTLTCSALMPQRTIKDNPPITSSSETDSSPSDTGGKDISENINKLEFSRIDEEIKNKLLTILREVYDVYNNPDIKKEEKIDFIKKAITKVENIIENDLTKNVIGFVLQQVPLTKDIGVGISNTNQDELFTALEYFKSRFVFLTGKGLDNAFTELSKAISDNLNIVSKEINPKDELYVVLLDFAKTLNNYARKSTKPSIVERIETMDKAKDDIWTALSHQLDANEMCIEVKTTLLKLLNELDPPEPPEPDETQSGSASTTPEPSQGNSSNQEESNNPSDTSNSSGGSSENSGGINFGKTESIFDPNTNTNVEYSQIIEEYYHQIIALINDNNLDMSVEEFINNYFNALYHPNNDENNGNEQGE